MKLLIAGGETGTRQLAEEAREGAETEVCVVTEPPGGEPSVAGLATRLRELDRRMSTEQPDAVLLADDTETALAALLVAAKRAVRVAATAAVSTSSSNGRLIAQLADERLEGAPGDWVQSYTEAR